MGRKKTHEEFILELFLVNPNIKILGTYEGSKEKIECKCKVCNHLWSATAGNLLSGKGCPECGKRNRGSNKKSNKEEFVKKAKLKHGDRYDYSKFIYTRAIDKSTIICPKHGPFEQTPHMHLLGNGCPKCNGGIKYSTEDFIQIAKKKHGNKYNYSKVNYIRNTIPVIISCPIHGEYEMTPQNHLAGCGCAQCGIEFAHKIQTDTKEQFIEKAQKVHENKYDYSKIEYINLRTKILINCYVHGPFEQLPYNHLNGYGCPKCSESKGEKLIRNILEKYNVRYIDQYSIDCIVNKTGIANVDFYLPDYKIIIEYNGIQHYEYIPYFHKGGIIDFERQQKRDECIKNYCKENNIILIEIPHTMKFNNIEEYLIKKLNIENVLINNVMNGTIENI